MQICKLFLSVRHKILKFIYFEKATKIWRNLQIVFEITESKKVYGFFVIFFWSSQNIWTLQDDLFAHQFFFLSYHKVPSSTLSWLVALPRIFRRLMNRKCYAYVLWPLAKKFQNWIVDWSTARDFRVIWIIKLHYLKLSP